MTVYVISEARRSGGLLRRTLMLRVCDSLQAARALANSFFNECEFKIRVEEYEHGQPRVVYTVEAGPYSDMFSSIVIDEVGVFTLVEDGGVTQTH